MTTPRSTTSRPDLLLALALGGLFAFALGFSLFWRPGAAQVEAPSVAPSTIVETAAPGASPAPTAAQEPVSAPVELTPAPLPTGYIIGTEAPQLAPAAPALAEPAVVYSDLVPLPPTTETAPRLCERAGVGPCRGARP